MNKVIDLTTKIGKKEAIKSFAAIGKVQAFPFGLLYKLITKLIDRPVYTQKEQSQTIEKILKAGKENGLDEMEIITENIDGFRLDIPIEDLKINTGLGNDGKIHIKAKFK